MWRLSLLASPSFSCWLTLIVSHAVNGLNTQNNELTGWPEWWFVRAVSPGSFGLKHEFTVKTHPFLDKTVLWEVGSWLWKFGCFQICFQAVFRSFDKTWPLTIFPFLFANSLRHCREAETGMATSFLTLSDYGSLSECFLERRSHPFNPDLDPGTLLHTGIDYGFPLDTNNGLLGRSLLLRYLSFLA